MTSTVIRDVLVRWQAGATIRSIARGTGLDRKTVRRYLAVAEIMRLERTTSIDDDTAEAIASVVRRGPSRVSATQQVLEAERERIRQWLAMRFSLAKIHAALERQGSRVSYATLRRFVIAELGWRGRVVPRLAA